MNAVSDLFSDRRIGGGGGGGGPKAPCSRRALFLLKSLLILDLYDEVVRIRKFVDRKKKPARRGAGVGKLLEEKEKKKKGK